MAPLRQNEAFSCDSPGSGPGHSQAMSDPRTEVPQAIQAVPSLGAILIWLSGKDINWWAAVLGMVFIGVQCAYALWKWRRDYVHERERQLRNRL